MTTRPFMAERYELGAATIVRLPASDAVKLGTALAAIDPWATHGYPPSRLAAYLADDEPNAPRFALKAGDEIAGGIGLRLNWLRGPYLQFLGILPAFQRRRLGRLVLDWIEQEARADNVRNVWVCASDFNEGAIAFYERTGFVRVANLEDLVSDGRAEVLLRKRL
jgi:ribosomal protein S18 acetylase RimI-like enzyme